MSKLAFGENVIVRTSVSTEFKYDSNTLSSGQSQNPTEDYVVKLAPQIEVINQRRAFTLGGKYIPTGYYYLENPQMNTLGHFASIDMKVQPSEKTTFSASDALRYTKESREALMTGIQTKRMGILTNDFSLNMAHDLSRVVSVAVKLADTVLKFEKPDAIDSRTDTADITGSFKATEKTTLTAGYSFTRYSFSASPKDSHIDSQTVRLGLNSRLSPTFEVSISGGATYFSSVSNDWVGNVKLRKTFENSSVSMGYSRTTSNTAGFTRLLNINETYSLRMDHAVTKTANIGIHGSYSNNLTKPEIMHLTSYEAGINGSWQAYSWMTVSAGYSHFQQWDNASPGDDTGDDIRRDQVFVNVTATPSEWRF